MSYNIGIVIVNWNNRDVILDCLSSLQKAGYTKTCSIVVVDNGSTDGSVQDIRTKFPSVSVLELHENLGYSGGNNAGIRYLTDRVQYILILNPDTIVPKQTIEKLVDEMEKDPNIGICGPIGGYIDEKRYSGGLIESTNQLIIQSTNQQIHTNTTNYPIIQLSNKAIDYVSGTCMLIRREVFEKVGLFYDPYFIYYEDVELCVRAKRARFQLRIVPTASIIHKESSSFGYRSPAHQYYMARNHLLFVERNAPMVIKMRELVRLPKTVWEHVQRSETFAVLGIRDFFLRRFGKKNL